MSNNKTTSAHVTLAEVNNDIFVVAKQCLNSLQLIN